MICFRCGATVPDEVPRCPSCEQDLAPGATLAAVPSAAARSRDRGSAKTAGAKRDKSDITHQLSVEDIFEEFAPEEEEFLGGQKTPAEQEDTTSNFAMPAELPEEREDSSPVLGVARAEAAARAADAARAMPPQPLSSPELMDEKLQSGPMPIGKPAARARELPRRELSPEPAPPRARELPRRELSPEPAPPPARASAPRPVVPKPSDPEPVTGQVLELSSPKPLPELAPALEPEPEASGPARVATAVKPLPRGGTAVTAPGRGTRSFVAVAVVGVALGLAAASAAVIALVVRQEDRAEQVRRERAAKRVQERLREAERLRAQGAVTPVAVAIGPEGCPAGMRRLGSAPAYCIDMYEYPGGRTLPRSNVTWREAKAACETRGGRLCAEKEWVEACRGEGGTDYPYGAKFEATRCNVARGGKPRDIIETGASAACKSAANLYDMSGNVAEWTADGSYRGGSAMSDADAARCSTRMTPGPDASNPYVGFRCCADPRAAAPPANPTGNPAPPPAAPTVKE